MIDYIDDTWPGGKRGFARWLRRHAEADAGRGRPQRDPAVLRTRFAKGYVAVGPAPGWVWYLRRDVDDATKKALRTALEHQSWRVEG